MKTEKLTHVAFSVLVHDVGCMIRATVGADGKITVVADGGCGPDCLGMRVPRRATGHEIENILRDRFIRLATQNMGARYDANTNDLIVEVRPA